MFNLIRNWLRRPRADERVRCANCVSMVSPEDAKASGGLCSFCVKNQDPEWQGGRNSPYHNQLSLPASELNGKEKRLQLSGAITWGNEARIDELLADGLDFISQHKTTRGGWFEKAITKNCEIAILNKLLAAGCDVNDFASKDLSETRPLGHAIRLDRLDVVKWLLDNGANPNLGRPIVGAINHDKTPDVQLETLSLLLAAGADINQTFDLFGDENKRFAVLDWAEMYGISTDVIDYLKKNGATKHWTNETTQEMQGKLGHGRIVS